jgi:hypothetical protein
MSIRNTAVKSLGSWMWLQFQLVPETYGSRGGGGFFFLSWRSLIVLPMMLPPMSSNCQTLPNAAFILSFAGSPAYTPADEQSDWSFLQMCGQRTSQIIWWLVHPRWTSCSTSCLVTQINLHPSSNHNKNLTTEKKRGLYCTWTEGLNQALKNLTTQILSNKLLNRFFMPLHLTHKD